MTVILGVDVYEESSIAVPLVEAVEVLAVKVNREPETVISVVDTDVFVEPLVLPSDRDESNITLLALSNPPFSTTNML